MNTTSRTIARNAGFLMASQLTTWAVTFIITIFLPRYLGATALGVYQVASSTWVMAGVVIGFGMDTLLAKEVARAPSRVSELLVASILLRTAIFLASFVLVAGYVHSAGLPEETRTIIYIVGLATGIGQLGAACRAALQGLERMEFISLSEIVAKAFLALGAVACMLKGYGLVVIAGLDIGAALIGLVVLWRALRKLQPIHFRFGPMPLAGMLRASFPYLLLAVCMTTYSQVGVIILSRLTSEAQIGWYSVAMRLVGTFLFVPAVFMTALLPASARLHLTAAEDLQRLVSKCFDLVVLLSVPIGLGLVAIAQQLLALLYGPDFITGWPILAVMGFAVIFLSLNMLLGQFLIASDRQNPWMAVMATATVVAIALDFVLIPWCQQVFALGALGTALASLIVETGMCACAVALLPKGTLGRQNAGRAVRVVLAGSLMLAAVWWARGLFIAFPIGIGIGIYFVLITRLRVFSPSDWVMLINLGRSILRRMGWPFGGQQKLDKQSPRLPTG